MFKENAVEAHDLGKMYKLYKNPSDKYKDAFGLNFFKKDYYREFWALRDINIAIKKGERVGLIGHNGAGKSTLLKAIIGRIEPSEGSIQVNGAVQALLELGTGFHPELTGRDNIKASLMLSGCSYKQIDEMIDDIIEFAELEEYIDQPVKTYSAGMYARLAFSTATAIKPELLIIDEVLGAGDAYFAGKCVERMRTLTKESGATVLFVSHDLASVQAICERVIWIDKGKIRYDGDTLTAIKLYSKSVRENDELRIKIRDLKISKKQALLLDRDQDLYHAALFHFIPKEQKSYKGKAKIRQIILHKDGEVLAQVSVGEPMDNDESAKNLILDDPEFMCWGGPEKDKKGYYRNYIKGGGRYRHAPFQMKYPKQFDSLNGMQLTVIADIEVGSELYVEYLDTVRGEYVLCGEIADQGEKFVFNLEENPIQQETDTAGKEQREDLQEERSEVVKKHENKLDYRATEECCIQSAEIYSKNGASRRAFPFEEPIDRFHFEISFKQPHEHFIFSFLIYSVRGEIAFNLCQEVQMECSATNVTLDIHLDDTRIGTGEYLITFGVYDSINLMDNSVEAPVLAIIDRAMAFKIEQPLHYQISMGLILPPLKISIQTKTEGGYKCNSLL